MLKVSDVNVN